MLDFNIITFHRSINFGAVLQAYALQEFIKKQNYSAGIYDYKLRTIAHNTNLRSKIQRVLAIFSRDKEAESRQAQKFAEFRKKNLNLNLQTDSKVFITGSDQVWYLNNNMDSMFFLQFLDDSVYKISYAASMPKTDVPNEKKDIVKEYLKTFDEISVREEGIKENLEPLCNRDISVNVDPTLLHDKTFYCDITTPPIKDLPEKYILAYIRHIPKNGNKLISWLHKETGLPVILLDTSANVGIIIKNNMIIRDAGPQEFVYLFKNAECVVTTSFHGTCFSLIFEKEFYSIVNPALPSRISNLLNKFGIQPINESDSLFTRRNNIDWDHVREILAQEKQCSEQYIRNAFEKAKSKKAIKPTGTVALMNDKCTGCAACEEICPTNAISMMLNSKGFYEPSVDKTKCVNCSKCIQSCPLNKKQVVWPKKAFYGWNSSPDVLFKSSSGGAFYSIAQTVLQKSGVVFGAAYSEDWQNVIFECTDDVAFEKLQKSKYTVSNASGVYKKIRKYLNDGRIVLFTGTPCQCAGIKSVFGDKYENLITCDFVCGGMPSLSFFREHIDALQKKYGSTIKSLDFRPKDWGWGKYRLMIHFQNGKKYIKRDFADTYFTCFKSKASVRHVCEECPYFHFHRSDFTIGDYWGYRATGIKKHKSGMSLVVCNNEKAEKLFEEVKDFEKNEIPMKYAHYAVRDKIPRTNKLKEKDRFFKLAAENGFEAAALEMYDINEICHYIKRIFELLHL